MFHSCSGAVCYHQGGEGLLGTDVEGRYFVFTDGNGHGCFSVWHASIIAHNNKTRRMLTRKA
jgi:hypothetical protein